MKTIVNLTMIGSKTFLQCDLLMYNYHLFSQPHHLKSLSIEIQVGLITLLLFSSNELLD